MTKQELEIFASRLEKLLSDGELLVAFFKAGEQVPSVGVTVQINLAVRPTDGKHAILIDVREDSDS
jgi:hypothetical protein